MAILTDSTSALTVATLGKAIQPENFVRAAVLVFTLFIAYSISRVVYNLWFHPLAKVPGSKLESAFFFPFAYIQYVQGSAPAALRKRHEKYGPVVRIGPNRLSYDGEVGWPSIFAHRRPGEPEYEKAPSPFGDKLTLLLANKENHRRQRRQLAHAFSDSSLVQQEATVIKYIDMLMASLTKLAKAGEPLDVVQWLNFTTFDIIGDLAFSDSFRSLESSQYNPWVLAIFQGIRGAAFLRFLMPYPIIQFLMRNIRLNSDVKVIDEIRYHARDKAKARMEYGAEKVEGEKDFTTYMMRMTRDGNPGMSQEEILQNAPTLVLAGSETTATTLSGFCFYVGQRPDVYSKIAAEIRSAFDSEDDITMARTASLPYLGAVINETLRLYPPVANTPERISPGGIIDGQYVPAGTGVSVSQWFTFRNPKHWVDPDSYIPERWLPASHPLYDERFQYDNHAVFKPFSFGSRDCIGKNLALAEMRLVICRLLLRFDFEILPGQEAWQSKQCSFVIWEKGQLMAKFSLREGLKA